MIVSGAFRLIMFWLAVGGGGFWPGRFFFARAPGLSVFVPNEYQFLSNVLKFVNQTPRST